MNLNFLRIIYNKKQYGLSFDTKEYYNPGGENVSNGKILIYTTKLFGAVLPFTPSMRSFYLRAVCENSSVTRDTYHNHTFRHIGRMLRIFTQLKRNKRFDNFIMLVWVQGSPFHIAAGLHPVQEVWGSQDRCQIQKLLQCCREPYQQIPLIITIQQKYSLTYLRRTVS